MNTEKKRSVLNGYKEAVKELEYWKAEYKQIQEQIGAASPSLSGMPKATSPGTSKVAIMAEELDEAQRHVDEARRAALEAKREAEKLIRTAPTADQRIVLRRRYIGGMTWEQIAEASGKSRQWATLTHGTALKNIFLEPEN